MEEARLAKEQYKKDINEANAKFEAQKKCTEEAVRTQSPTSLLGIKVADLKIVEQASSC